MKIEKFVLMGHSLGGYISCCYALQYPQHVEKLILASPVGVPPETKTVDEMLKNAVTIIYEQKQNEKFGLPL